MVATMFECLPEAISNGHFQVVLATFSAVH